MTPETLGWMIVGLMCLIYVIQETTIRRLFKISKEDTELLKKASSVFEQKDAENQTQILLYRQMLEIIYKGIGNDTRYKDIAAIIQTHLGTVHYVPTDDSP